MYRLPEVFCFIFLPKEINAKLQNRKDTLIREVFLQHTWFYKSKKKKKPKDKEESFV